ncbi:hypothetical protein FACS1894201_04420 [Bacteroidia bacterium]|nr:hypothetical protein FACS1894201_04420 [Bacteroidia bacterium]
MIIANPIYDLAFKRLMESERVAKFFIGTLLGQTIEAVTTAPQEFSHYNKDERLAVFRLDFVATILTASGEHKKVLIEMQKAKELTDLMRFRGYLGEQYKKADMVNDRREVLPITSIYVLGFNLPEIDSACIKIGREYTDMITQQTIAERSRFIECLTHDSYVVQTRRISQRYQTQLDKLMSVFAQENFTDDKEVTKQYTHETDDVDIKAIVDILHHVGTDPAERKELDNEIEWRRTYEEWFGDRDRQIIEKDKKIEEKEQALAAEKEKKAAALAAKDAALARIAELEKQLLSKQ